MKILNAFLAASFLFAAEGYSLTQFPPHTQFLTKDSIKYSQGQHFLLSFPRSGTNITACMMQAIAQKPLKFLYSYESRPSENMLNLDLDFSKPILYRTHYWYELEGASKSKNKLLFLLRNYKESLIRDNFSTNLVPEKFKTFITENQYPVLHYIENLRTYDTWDPDQRLLIHYEDLMVNPIEQIKKILTFFNEPIPDNLEELWDYAKTGGMAFYDERHAVSGGSQSKGQDLEFHSKKLDPETVRIIDQHFEKSFPYLWRTYLNRYKTP